MSGQNNSRLSKSVVVVPEQGDAQPVRLVQVTRPANQAYPPGAVKAQDRPVMKEAAAPPIAPEPKAPPGRTVTGRVRDPQGRPLAGMSVYLDRNRLPAGEPRPMFDSAATDQDGVFILRGLPTGELTILLHRPDVENPSKVLSNTVAADQDSVDLVYEPGPRSPALNQPKPPVEKLLLPGLKERLTFVDLEPRGNEFVVDGPGGGGNDLARLPRGVQRMGETFFRVGEKLIHLRGRLAPGMPDSVTGISVGARATKLHFAHGVQWGVPAGTEVGAYNVHYADGSSVRIPVVYGRDVVNWWAFAQALPELPTNARIAWSGSNDAIEMDGWKVFLFAVTWINPHPDRIITTIDATSTDAGCDPFLVAITLERDAPPPPEPR
jgi:hypothetical protein